MNVGNILEFAFTFSANALAIILFWWFKKLERDVSEMRKEVYGMKVNYLDRFEDLKEHISRGNLEIMQRLSKLEVSSQKQ